MSRGDGAAKRAALEPAVANMTGDDAPIWSAAISLKRIADALTGKGESILTAPINMYGEGIGSAIQGQMIRGQNGNDRF